MCRYLITIYDFYGKIFVDFDRIYILVNISFIRLYHYLLINEYSQGRLIEILEIGIRLSELEKHRKVVVKLFDA